MQWKSIALSSFSEEELTCSDSPIALIVLAYRRDQENTIPERRKSIKLQIFNLGKTKGYTQAEHLALYRFVDGLLPLSDNEEEEFLPFWKEIAMRSHTSKLTRDDILSPIAQRAFHEFWREEIQREQEARKQAQETRKKELSFLQIRATKFPSVIADVLLSISEFNFDDYVDELGPYQDIITKIENKYRGEGFQGQGTRVYTEKMPFEVRKSYDEAKNNLKKKREEIRPKYYNKKFPK
jgi:hypothetical protein